MLHFWRTLWWHLCKVFGWHCKPGLKEYEWKQYYFPTVLQACSSDCYDVYSWGQFSNIQLYSFRLKEYLKVQGLSCILNQYCVILTFQGCPLSSCMPCLPHHDICALDLRNLLNGCISHALLMCLPNPCWLVCPHVPLCWCQPAGLCACRVMTIQQVLAKMAQWTAMNVSSCSFYSFQAAHLPHLA